MSSLRNEPSRIRRSLMAAALMVALLVASPTPVSACSCGGSSRTMPVVFVGRVVAVVESWALVKRLTGKRCVLTGSTIALLVANSIDPGTEVNLYAVIGGYDADCYVSFEPGRFYVIYGERVNYGLVDTTICHGSGEV